MIQLIGDAIIRLDNLRCGFYQGTETRTLLDNIHYMLSRYQDDLVRELINVNNSNFENLGTILATINNQLQRGIVDIENLRRLNELLGGRPRNGEPRSLSLACLQ